MAYTGSKAIKKRDLIWVVKKKQIKYNKNKLAKDKEK